MTNELVIRPDWPAPSQIKAYTTLREGGVSLAPYHNFNLGMHTGDNPIDVSTNRRRLKTVLGIPSEPIWLNQTHSAIVLPALLTHLNQEADATYTDELNRVCIVLTADCLPILLCHHSGSHVAAIHAGWRGLVKGIISETLTALKLPPEECIAWLGPAIGPEAFEVGNIVRQLFIQCEPETATAFIPSPNGKWLGNLYTLARCFLQKQGVTHIYGGTYCTYSEKSRFFSYRRDGEKTGRMASLIWINDSRINN